MKQAKSKWFFFLLAFLLPLLTWSAVSYLPFLWHPFIKVVDAGDTAIVGDYDYLAEGMLIDPEVFEKRNITLRFRSGVGYRETCESHLSSCTS